MSIAIYMDDHVNQRRHVPMTPPMTTDFDVVLATLSPQTSSITSTVFPCVPEDIASALRLRRQSCRNPQNKRAEEHQDAKSNHDQRHDPAHFPITAIFVERIFER